MSEPTEIEKKMAAVQDRVVAVRELQDKLTEAEEGFYAAVSHVFEKYMRLDNPHGYLGYMNRYHIGDTEVTGSYQDDCDNGWSSEEFSFPRRLFDLCLVDRAAFDVEIAEMARARKAEKEAAEAREREDKEAEAKAKRRADFEKLKREFEG